MNGDAAEREPASARGISPAPAMNLVDVEQGTRVQLAGGAIAEVVLNPRDGMWLHVRYLTNPSDPSLEGSEAMVFADDVVGAM